MADGVPEAPGELRGRGRDRPDLGVARADEEVELWKQRDPITIHTALLLSQGFATQAEIEQMDAQVTQEMEEAVEFARQSPYPDPAELFEDMFANPIPLE